MGSNAFEERLWQIIPQDYLNEYEKEELVDLIAGFDRSLDDLIIQQVAAIWPISSALCFSILEDFDNLLKKVSPAQVPEWTREILEVFELDGLRAARHFMADEDNIFFQRLRGMGALSFEEVSSKLLPYVRGLANRSLNLEAADHAGTDTSTIFLPREISTFSEEQRNFLLYKFIVTFQWALIHNDCYCHRAENYSELWSELLYCSQQVPDSSKEVVLDLFFSCYPKKRLARDIYHLLHSIKAIGLLRVHVPGLMSDAQFIFDNLTKKRASGGEDKKQGRKY